jgi:hypothetical protein
MPPIPPIYRVANWRNTTPVDSTGRIGIGFDNADGSTTRLSLDVRSAAALGSALTEALSGARIHRNPITGHIDYVGPKATPK